MSTTLKPNRVQGMVRSMDQWRNMEAKAVAAGSAAMIEYALIDAAHDIGALWSKLEEMDAAWNRRADGWQPEHIDRLKDAVEGECDGLALVDAQATAILRYVFGEDKTLAGGAS